MKKIIFFIFTFVLLFSQDIKEDLSYKLKYGLYLYETKQYTKAYNYFYDLFQKNLDNPRINFYLGLCAEKLKRYNLALEAFERVLIKDPTNLRARLEYARVLFYLGEYKESKKEFLKVLKHKIPLPVKRNIEKFLLVINNLEKKVKYNFLISVALKHDNNVNDISTDSDILKDTIFYNLPTTTTNQKESDFFNEDLLVANQQYDIGDIGGWKVDNSVTLFSQFYKKYTENNLLYLSLAPGLDYKLNNFLIKNSMFFNVLNINNARYLNSWGMRISLFKPYKNFILNPVVSFEKKYFHQNKNMNSIQRKIMFSLDQKLSESIIRYSVYYINEDAKVAAENSYIKKDFNINYLRKLNSRLFFNLGYEFYKKYYNQKSVLFLRKRVDFQYDYLSKISYKIKRNFETSFLLKIIHNKSTRIADHYNKIIEGINFTLTF